MFTLRQAKCPKGIFLKQKRFYFNGIFFLGLTDIFGNFPFNQFKHWEQWEGQKLITHIGSLFKSSIWVQYNVELRVWVGEGGRGERSALHSVTSSVLNLRKVNYSNVYQEAQKEG